MLRHKRGDLVYSNLMMNHHPPAVGYLSPIDRPGQSSSTFARSNFVFEILEIYLGYPSPNSKCYELFANASQKKIMFIRSDKGGLEKSTNYNFRILLDL